MSLRIKYTADCECGGKMVSEELDFTKEPGAEVVIDLDMFGDFQIECVQCGDAAWVPAISDHIEDLD